MARERYGKWYYEQDGGIYRIYYDNQRLKEVSTLTDAIRYVHEQYIHELERRDVIGAIVTSTTNLYERFGVTPNRENTVEKFTDEMTEFLDELISDTVNPAKLKDEFGDLLVTAIMATRQHLTEAQMIEAVWQVVAKNNRKTSDTHEVIGGLITRKSKTKATA